MQKLELLKTIQDFRTGKIDYGVVLSAVEQREKALLQQCDVLRLREILELKVTEIQQQQHLTENYHEYMRNVENLNALTRVMSLMVVQKPVA